MQPNTPDSQRARAKYVSQLALEWPEMGPTSRAEAIRDFPELAQMGLRADAPDTPASQADERSTQQCRMIDEGPDPHQ